MLQLKNIVKDYGQDDQKVHALQGVNLAFRDSEFVSILGPSGCGKTTLLNIIGGLDTYTSGDLVINGRSTKEYKASDWDTYRNHSIGFVFQSYNLIPHQTVLSNVELALTLSGVSKADRRKRAIQALEKVGLGDQLKKKPNQMSGGQMQRVAIARALVNDPDILLADEPTGALDTETSVQIMELLKEIANDRLIIMVTHNPDLAERYSSRIVRLLDGRIVDDSAPFEGKEVDEALPKAREKAEAERAKGKKSMSFFTALSLSFNNLMTKRARTLLTSFAGSIGIIGIALILAVSTGVNAYIASVQRDTLSSYPISIRKEETDLSAFLGGGENAEGDNAALEPHENDAVYSNPMLFRMFNTLFAPDRKENNLAAFKAFLDREMDPATAKTELAQYVSAIQYSYAMPMNTYVKNRDGQYVTCDLSKAFSSAAGQVGGNDALSNMMSANLTALNLWQEILPDKDGSPISSMLYEKYDLVYGDWPKEPNEIVLILNSNNEVSDIVFYALGYISQEEVNSMVGAALSGQKLEISRRKLSYEDVTKISFKLLLPSDYYADRDGDGTWEYIGNDEAMMNVIIGGAYDLKISGIIRPNESATAGAFSAPFGYTAALTQYLIEKNNESALVKAQTAPENENKDLLSGLPFVREEEGELSDAAKAAAVASYFASLTEAEKAALYREIYTTPTDAYLDAAVKQLLAGYDTRDKMVAMIAESLGMPADQIEGYLSAYSDEELLALVTEQAKTVVATQYTAQKNAEVDRMLDTPSEEELALLLPTITAQLTTKEAKIAFVAASWKQDVTMDDAAIFAYLSSLSDEALNEAVTAVAKKQAAALYATYGDTFASSRVAKAAAAFDASYGAETDVATLAWYYDTFLPSSVSSSTKEEVYEKLGIVDAAAPSGISIYAVTFADKDNIASIISDYNASVDEKDAIEYTDYIALLLSGITQIINAVSYVLIAFVSISLVVSSIMIGIITYISVLERTKEIGILRAIGASKHDVSLVFNAETIIVGLAAGLLGIVVSLLLCIPINVIIHALSGVDAINAFLQPLHCVILVLISVFLTMIAGLIPSRIAARKDPVEALRTE